jgi:hypothetical protein
MVKSKMVPALAIALGALAVAAITGLANASHVRPQGASPLRVSFVPAYKPCSAPNRTHGAPLAHASCTPPVQASNFLTVGTPDANGAHARAAGSMTVKVKVTSPQDVLISLSVSDVRCKPGTSANVCNSPNSADGPDYSGDLQTNAMIRISDHYNGSGLNEAATVQDIPFPVNVPCANTADTSIGATCSITTCSSCIGPPRGDIEGQRTVVEITQFQMYDGGGDGQVASPSDNTVFMRQGVFIP